MRPIEEIKKSHRANNRIRLMNISKERWVDFTWNPITGCQDNCDYCYGARQAQRFSGDTRLNKASDQLIQDLDNLYILEKPFKNISTGKVTPHPVGFEPTMHRYRLPMIAQKKKPAKILVCSMGDLFGPWISDERIGEVFKATEETPWHTYFFITKYPARYIDLADKGILPRAGKNYWYGTRINNPDDRYFWARGLKTYALVEPILEDFGRTLDPDRGPAMLNWIILGAETGNRKGKVNPKKEWIMNIVASTKIAGTPLFIKDSLAEIWQEELIQEWPEGLPKDNPVPHCSKCQSYEQELDGKRGNKHICTFIKEKRIPGRYARTSPPWCPKRVDGYEDDQ